MTLSELDAFQAFLLLRLLPSKVAIPKIRPIRLPGKPGHSGPGSNPWAHHSGSGKSPTFPCQPAIESRCQDPKSDPRFSRTPFMGLWCQGMDGKGEGKENRNPKSEQGSHPSRQINNDRPSQHFPETAHCNGLRRSCRASASGVDFTAPDKRVSARWDFFCCN